MWQREATTINLNIENNNKDNYKSVYNEIILYINIEKMIKYIIEIKIME